MTTEKLLHRQVNPNFVINKVISIQAFKVNNEISSQVFKLKKADNGFLSTYNDSNFSPEAAYEHYKATGYDTAGTVSVSEAECNKITLDIIEDNIPFVGHASIDLSKETTSSADRKAKLLKSAATNRGWTFGPINL